VQNFVGNLPQEYKDIDVLVNNAYVITPIHTLVGELTDTSAAL